MRAELPRGFEKINGAESIDFEVDNGNLAGLIVGRLGGTMENEIERRRAKELEDGGALADIEASPPADVTTLRRRGGGESA